MLTLEWKHRLDNWRQELFNHIYRPLGAIPLGGFVTKEQLTLQEAAQRSYEPFPVGTQWGAKWEYGWFKGQVTLPEAAKGKRIVLLIDVGGESAVYVNGVAVGEADTRHPGMRRDHELALYHELLLAEEGVPGAHYEVFIEGYAGHGPRKAYAGPTPPGRIPIPEPPDKQATIGECTFGVWQEDVYQLLIDVQTLYDVREALDPDSLRVQEIDVGLRDFTTIVDFELPNEEMLATVRACRARLKPLLDCVNGSTMPTLYAFGHAHIDVAWLWPLAETERKCVRTFANQLALMAQYPEYKFLQSQPHLYWMVKTHYPDLYARIKEAVAAGQFIPEGGMWVEADTNISGGESLIRQFIHGKRFFKDEFGVECELLWLPDVFGYSGALPQIMRGCGIKYFSTQKIFWTYNSDVKFPLNTFWWEGIDGSRVLVHLHNDYNSLTNPAATIQRWRERVQKDGFSTRLMPFGWGDGGGGPTRMHLDFLRRQKNLEGVPKVVIASPLDYFKDQEQKPVSNRYVGELYFQAHRGTYTTQAKTKLGNRRSEIALREAELWSVVAAPKGYVFPAATMDTAWKKVLLNQFHDIIPGSSIHRVYEEAEAAYADVIATANDVTAQATAALVSPADALTVFNSLSWERTAMVTLPAGWQGARDASGPLPVQTVDGALKAEVRIPACGWTTLHAAPPSALANPLVASPTLLENDLLRVTFDAAGQITGIYDKETGRELAAGVCNALKMYKDIPTNWDAWDLDSMYEATPVALDSMATVTVLDAGPLVARLQVKRMLNHSPMTQTITLRRGSRRVEFHTVIDWNESHKLLKVNFPVNVYSTEALHEIQFGHIARPTHKSRPFDAERFEVAAHKWTALIEANRGFAVLNDCKYGVNVDGNSINLTLLRAPLAPDMYADKGRQEFTYAFYAWNGPLFDSALVREGYELNIPVVTVMGDAGGGSAFSVDAPNVVIETVKPAEDGSGDVIVRLYEALHSATRCTLSTSLPVRKAAQTTMLETFECDLAMQEGRIALDFRPFEIKTVRLSK